MYGNKNVIEAGKLLTIGLLALISLAISIYFLFFSPYIGFRFVYVFIPHLYLIPIILLSMWYPKSGVKLVFTILILLFLFWIFTNVLGYYTYTPLFVILYTGIDLAVIMVLLLYVKDRRLVEAVILDIIERKTEKKEETQELINKFEGDFDVIITALGSKDESAREEAVLALASLSDDRIIFPLINALKDENPHIRRITCEALGHTDSPKVVKPLIKALTDEDRYVRETAAEELGHLGKVSIVELMNHLDDPDWRIRMGSVIALRVTSECPDPDPILKTLSDPSVYVRREAVKTLGRIGDQRILPYIIESINDSDPGVRLRAVRAISRIGSTDDIECILKRKMSDPDGYVRLLANEEFEKLRIR